MSGPEQAHSGGETTLVDMHGMADIDHVTRIDRETQFGNPFKLKSDGGSHTLEESIRRYTVWFWDKLDRDPAFKADTDQLEGETLGCWCVDTREACHGEVILEYLRDESSAPDPADERDRFAAWLRAADLSVVRHIDVNDGEKRTHDHTQRAPDDPALSGNSGIYGGRGAQHYEACIDVPQEEWSDTEYVWDCDCTCGNDVLVDVDIDDGTAFIEAGADEHAPPTLRVQSPHAGIGETATEADVEGHNFYRVSGSVEEVEGAINDLMTGDAVNPSPSWGEIRVFNQYVVGPGSEITSCDKDWHECTPDDPGRYLIVDDRSIETLTPDELCALICADGAYPDTAARDDETTTLSDAAGGAAEREGVDIDADETPTENGARDGTDPETVVKANKWIAEYLALGGADDRSKKDFAVCRELIEQGVSESDAFELLNDSKHTKVHERGQKYWRTTWRKAKTKADTSDSNDDRDADLPIPTTFEERNGCYGYTTGDGEDEEWTTATTFQLEARSFIVEDGGADVTAQLRVHPASAKESPYDVAVPMGVFNEPRKFRTAVVVGRTTTFELGGGFLSKLRRFVGQQDVPIRAATRQIGLHGTELVTPDGVLTADGWAADPETVLVDNDTTVPGKWSLDPEDGSAFDRTVVADILELLPQTRESERFLPALGWFYACAFRPLIKEWTGEFNPLSITGDTGAGKTATIELLWKLFGMDGEPLSPDGTNFTQLTAFSSSNAIPVVFDEFKPSEMSDYELKQFKKRFRKSTRGETEPRGNPDQTEDQWHINSPVVVSGEQFIAGPAEERRAIQTVFDRDVTDTDSAPFRRFAELIGGNYVADDGETVYCDGYETADHARAWYRWALDHIANDTEMIRETWQAAGEHLTDLMADHGLNPHPTELQGFQTILFGCWMFQEFCETMGANAAQTGVTTGAIEEAILFTAEAGSGHEHVSHLDRLLGVAARAAAADYLTDGDHYRVVRPRDGGEHLRLKLPSSFDQIRRYARDHDVRDGDLLDNVIDYRRRIQDAEADMDSVVISNSVHTAGLNKTCAFDVATATERIDAFERGMFVADSDDESDADDADIPDETVAYDAIPLDRVAATQTGYVTVTARLTTVEPIGRENTGVRATLIDSSNTPIDLVTWDEDNGQLLQNLHGECAAFEHLKVGAYEGTTQLEFAHGTSSIHTIQQGVGYSPGTESESQPLTESTREEFESGKAMVTEIVTDHAPIDRDELTAILKRDHEYPVATGARFVDRALSDGRIMETDEGVYKPGR